MWVVHFTFMFFCNCPNKICFYDKREREANLLTFSVEMFTSFTTDCTDMVVVVVLLL